MSVQRSEADAKIYKLFWGEHRPSVAFRLRGAELFSRENEFGLNRGRRLDSTMPIRLVDKPSALNGEALFGVPRLRGSVRSSAFTRLETA